VRQMRHLFTRNAVVHKSSQNQHAVRNVW